MKLVIMNLFISFYVDYHIFSVFLIGTCSFIDLLEQLALCSIEEKEGMYDLFNNIEMPLAYVLADMELNGMKVDKNILEELLAYDQIYLQPNRKVGGEPQIQVCKVSE